MGGGRDLLVKSHPFICPGPLDQLFEWLTTLSNQPESTVELLSNSQVQYSTVQNTISALESMAMALEDLVRLSPHSDYPHCCHPYISHCAINKPKGWC